MKEEAAVMQKMEEQKAREKAAAEGKDPDPEGKYSGGKENKPMLEGSGAFGKESGSGSGTGTGSGKASGSGSGTGSGSGNATKRPAAGQGATRKH